MVPVDEKMTQCLHFIDRKQGPERPSDFLKVTQQGSSPNTGCHESQISLVLEGYDIRRWGGGVTECPAVEASLPTTNYPFPGAIPTWIQGWVLSRFVPTRGKSGAPIVGPGTC